jgi:hypothetical protein
MALILKKLVGAMMIPRFRRDTAALVSACHDPLARQEALLKERLAETTGSQMAHDYGLAEVRTVADLRQRMPLMDYDDLDVYIRRIVEGDPSALFAPHI